MLREVKAKPTLLRYPKRESKSRLRTSQGGGLDGSLLPRSVCVDIFRKAKSVGFAFTFFSCWILDATE